MIKKRLVCVVLVLAMMCTMFPFATTNVQAALGVPEPENHALHKPYLYSYPAVASSDSPDSYGVELTDGIYAKSGFGDPAWQAVNCDPLGNYGLTVNLRNVTKVTAIKIRFLEELDKGIYPPAGISFKTSMDGAVFQTIEGSMVKKVTDNVCTYEFTANSATDALFVMACLDAQTDRSSVIYSDEIEVFGTSDYNEPILLSLNKPYTTTIEAHSLYPDSDKREMTNGEYAKEGNLDPEWSGRYFGTNAEDYYAVTMDLEGKKNVSEATISFLADQNSGINFPTAVKISHSNDGVNFNDIGFATYRIRTNAQDGSMVAKYRLTLPYTIEAQYVKFGIYVEGWVLSDEVEVFGHENAIPDMLTKITTPTEPLPDKKDFTNIALGKEYETLYDSTEYTLILPDTDDKELTDGRFGSTQVLNDERWTGCDLGAGGRYSYVIDLEKSDYDLKGIMAEFMEDGKNNIYFPSSVTVSYSNDKSSFTPIGKMVSQVDIQGKRAYKLPFENIKARYIKIEIHSSCIVAIDEVQIYDGQMPKPTLDGGFMVLYPAGPEKEGLYAINYFNADELKRQVDVMKQLGMNYIVISRSADTRIKRSIYPTQMEGYAQATDEAHGYGCSDPIQVILDRAGELGMKVFLGVALNSEWYNGIGGTEDEKISWIDREIAEEKKIVTEIHGRYKHNPSLTGFYLTNETCDYWISGDQWQYSRRLYKGVSDHIRQLGEEYKVMIAPACWSSSTPEQYAVDMRKLLQPDNVGGRPVADVVAMQDGIGVGHAQFPPNYAKYEDRIQLISAVVRELGAEFWNDTEIFKMPEYSDMNTNWIEKSLNMESKYSNISICFDISSYFDPYRISGLNIHGYAKYKDYYDRSGSYTAADQKLPVFEPEVKLINENTLAVVVKADERGDAYVVCLPKGDAKPSPEQVKRGKDSKGQVASLKGKASVRGNLEQFINIEGVEAEKSYDVHVVMEDCSGNITQKKVEYTVVPKYKVKNVAIGKTYTTDIKQHTTYKDDGKKLTDGKKGFVPSEPNLTLVNKDEWMGGALQTGKTSYDVIIKLSEGQPVDNISRFSTSYLQLAKASIYLPASVKYSVSNDGTNYTDVGTVNKPSGVPEADVVSKSYDLNLQSVVSAVYVKAQVNHSISWSFMDEFQVMMLEPKYVTENVALGKTYTADIASHGTYGNDGKKLTDGKMGSIQLTPDGTNATLKPEEWMGAKPPTGKTSYDVIVKLSEGQPVDNISKLSASYLQLPKATVYLPASVEYSISDDGTNYTVAGKVYKPSGVPGADIVSKPYDLDLKSVVSAVYVKAQVTPAFSGTTPIWSFIDEFQVMTVKSLMESPKVIENTYVKLKNAYFDSVEIDYKFEEDVDAYFVCVEARSDAPTPQQIMDGKDRAGNSAPYASTSCRANEAGTVVINNLDGSTDYSVYVVAKPKAAGKNYSRYKVNFETRDNRPPLNGVGYPKMDRAIDTAVSVNVKINENGTVYFICLPKDSSAPTAYQVKNGRDADGKPVAASLSGSIGMKGNELNTFTVSGFESEKTYDIFIVAEDSLGNMQQTPSKIRCSTVGENVALGRKYVASVPANAQNYPDTDGVELTDGKSGDPNNVKDPAWQGRSSQAKYHFVVDLETEQYLGSLMITFLKYSAGSIYLPSEVVYYTSSDNEEFVRVGSVLTPTVPERGVGVYQLNLERPIKARYVKIEALTPTGWSFTDEFKAFKVIVPEDTTPPAWNGGSVIATDVTQTSLTLIWSGACDNVGTVAYAVYKDGSPLATVTSSLYNVTGLMPGNTYSFKIEAGDAAGNWSSDGPRVMLTTMPVPEVNNVIFDSNGGSQVLHAMVSSGEKATRPDEPVKSGYVFDGWRIGGALGQLYDFDTPVTENITLYASWKPGIVVTDVSCRNGQASVSFDIKSANGRGYVVYISESIDGPYILYNNLNYNAKGVHIKDLTNGKTYYVTIEYANGTTKLKSDPVKLSPNK